MMKRLLTCVVMVSALSLVACGGDEDNNGTNNGMTTGSNNGTTDPNNGTTDPNNGTTDPNNGTTSDDQCEAAGDVCVDGAATASGFICAESVCLEECVPPLEGEQYPCRSGSVCIPVSEGGPSACLPSDCTGPLDTTSCDATETCFPVINNSNLCIPAGDAALGEECDTFDGCVAGLQCVGECVTPCGADATCDTAGGESCVGEEDDVLGAGAGFCDVSCTSYDTAAANCPAGQGCLPFTATEGICVDAGTVAPFGACVPDSMNVDEQCGPSTSCIVFQSEDAAAGIDGVATCLPFCNGAAASQADKDATCPGGQDFCLDFSLFSADQDPSPQSGRCFESCAPAEYGTGNACTGVQQCRPFQGTHACFGGSGAATPGNACTPSDLLAGCEEGNNCVPIGDGTGVCYSYCETDDVSNNANLTCAANEVCNAIGGSFGTFGECGVPCTGTDFADTTCPTFLQTCLPDGANASVCSASGNKAVGDACQRADSDCAAGTACVNGQLIGLGGEADEAGACGNYCEIFKAAGEPTDCPAGSACAVEFGTLSTEFGVCAPLGANTPVAPGAACTTLDAVCGDNALCFDDGQGGGSCLHLCTAASGCENAQNCVVINNGQPVLDGVIGVCPS